jgi:FkbH-like protein
MADNSAKCLVLSEFNAENLGAIMQNCADSPALEMLLPDFGTGLQILNVGGHPIWAEKPEYVFTWTRAEGVITSFKAMLQGDEVSESAILDEVKNYATAILKSSENDGVKAMFVASWTAPHYRRGLGMLDFKPGGYSYMINKMNLVLADALASSPKVFMLNASRWMQKVGSKAYSSAGWYRGKVPFSIEVFEEAVVDLKAGIRGLLGQARKLIVLDLDNTCWGGIIGDDGIEGIKLGGHDPEGEAFVDFQNGVKELTKRGIVLGVSSKNEESVAMEAIKNHDSMVLRKDDFAGWRINWRDKAANIADLVSEINLGLQSAVFLDDNPTERGRVREALPEVYVPEWPKKPQKYLEALQELPLFDLPSISKEDRKRAQMYAAERKRADLKEGADEDTWLSQLQIKAEIEEFSALNQQRIVQLLNKTNQMNLTTRRLTLEELQDWLAVDGRALWTVNVSDKFGEYGLTGIFSVDYSQGGDTAQLVEFILSCRVFGKNIEETMVHIAAEHARANGAKELAAYYFQTKKNKPCLTFFQERSGMTFSEIPVEGAHPNVKPSAPHANLVQHNVPMEGADTIGLLTWDTAKQHPAPKYVEIIRK